MGSNEQTELVKIMVELANDVKDATMKLVKVEEQILSLQKDINNFQKQQLTPLRKVVDKNEEELNKIKIEIEKMKVKFAVGGTFLMIVVSLVVKFLEKAIT